MSKKNDEDDRCLPNHNLCNCGAARLQMSNPLKVLFRLRCQNFYQKPKTALDTKASEVLENIKKTDRKFLTQG